MSKIARYLTKMTGAELFDADTPSLQSLDEVRYPNGVLPRQSIRVAARKLQDPQKLAERKARALAYVPRALRDEPSAD